MIGRPRGRVKTFPVYVYDASRGRKVYIGSAPSLEEAQALEASAASDFELQIPRPQLPRQMTFQAGYVINELTGCWLWYGSFNSNGYGRFWNGERHLAAHRVVYEREVGPIPEGLELDHLCWNPRCVNPKHLEPVTTAENIGRAVLARENIIEVPR